jgi:excisionase family DNA binding protein
VIPFSIESSRHDESQRTTIQCLLICEITIEDAADCYHEDNEFMTPEPFVTANEVAGHLKITRRQVLEMARKNHLPAYPLLGSRRKVWRFKLSEVDAVASDMCRPSFPHNDDGALAQKSPQSTMRVGSPGSQKGRL